VKIVLDTNVLISGIFWGGHPKTILEMVVKGSIKVYATEPIVKEYFRIIEKIGKKNPTIVNEWKMLLLDLLNIIETNEKIKVCRDEYDDMFIECAMACGAKYIVSGDDDLLILKKYEKILIITPKQYLDI
jgi:uncharacterized protein